MQFLSGYSVILPKATSVCKWLALVFLLAGCATKHTGRVQRVEGTSCEHIIVIYETTRENTDPIVPAVAPGQ